MVPSTPLLSRGVGTPPSVSSRVGSKLPPPLYADVRLHIPTTHHNDAGRCGTAGTPTGVRTLVRFCSYCQPTRIHSSAKICHYYNEGVHSFLLWADVCANQHVFILQRRFAIIITRACIHCGLTFVFLVTFASTSPPKKKKTGEDGYIRLARGDGINACGVADQPLFADFLTNFTSF